MIHPDGSHDRAAIMREAHRQLRQMGCPIAASAARRPMSPQLTSGLETAALARLGASEGDDLSAGPITLEKSSARMP